MENNESYKNLIRLGFRPSQIDRLRQLRRSYAEREQLMPEQRRLEFIRWLVTTGRLTDRVVDSGVR